MQTHPASTMSRHVPGLGQVQGVLPVDFKNVERYRGIPYGSISARFRQSKLVTKWADDKLDATKYGFVVEQLISHAKLMQPIL